MKRRRTISYTLTLVVGSCALAPAAAMAGGPLLSGYGGPGAGAQTIIGATLLNGPGNGSSSGSGGSGSGGSSSPLRSSHSTAPSPGAGGSGQAAKAGSGGGGAGRVSSTRAGSSNAGSTASRTGAYPAAATSAGASWFSGADLLALLLAAGVLALVAVATVRLAATQATHHD
jgi:hypothetical protein